MNRINTDNKIYKFDTALLTEDVLKKDWFISVENKAWKDLQKNIIEDGMRGNFIDFYI